MKTFHPLSFGLGLLSGLLILSVAVGGFRILRPTGQTRASGSRAGFQQRQGGRMGQDLSRMAEQIGMTEEDLRKELASGKTLRAIAQEKGVTLEPGTRIRATSGSVVSSSGSSVPAQQ